MVKQIGAAKFKEQCLKLIDNLTADGIVITKRGKPVARVLPVHVTSSQLIGTMADKIRITGDLIGTGRRWDAES